MLHFDYKIKKAADFEAQGKTLHAVQIYMSIINDDKTYALAYIKLANLYDRTGYSESAISLLKKYLTETGDDVEIRLFLGQILLKNDLWQEAIEAFSVFDPEERPLIAFFTGYAHFMLREFEISRVHFNNFLEYDKSTEFQAETYLYLAKVHVELGVFDEALKYAKMIEEVYHNNWELHLTMAIIFYNTGMYSHSVTSINKAIKLNEKEPSLYEWAGKANFKLGDYKGAEKYFLKFIENSEASSEAYSFLALTYLNTRKIKEAKNYFDLALSLDPANEIALDGRKKCN